MAGAFAYFGNNSAWYKLAVYWFWKFHRADATSYELFPMAGRYLAYILHCNPADKELVYKEIQQMVVELEYCMYKITSAR